MKCPQHRKVCKPSICFMSDKANYICSGISSKPSKYQKDCVWLCLKGKYSKTDLEMTRAEATAIVSALTGTLFGIEILQEEIGEK